MKDDSSASQMTAAKVMDVIAKRPDCARQAAHAVLAYSQVKMKDAPKLLKIPAPALCRGVHCACEVCAAPAPNSLVYAAFAMIIVEVIEGAVCCTSSAPA